MPKDESGSFKASVSYGLIARAARMGSGSHWPYAVGSRTRDFVVGLFALTVSLPVLIILGAAARSSSGASTLFKQERMGKDGRTFVIYKLRTMYPDAPTNVHRTQSGDRVTPVGRYLRKTKIDELPQLWNVVKGDMALVGPRPIIPNEYGDGHQRRRLAVRPGLTGLWQLSRVRDEPFHQNPEYDLFYLTNRSLAFDTWLIWRTVLLLLTGTETRIRLAARIWERDGSWRKLVPHRERAIPARTGWLRSRLWLATALLLVIAVVGLGGWQTLKARSDLLAASTQMTEAKAALGALDAGAAGAALDSAEVSFNAADGRLNSWMTLGLRAIPGINSNIAVGQAVTKAGSNLVAAGREGLNVLNKLPTNGGRISPPFKAGVLDGAALVSATAPAASVQRTVTRAQELLAASPNRFLLPQVAQARTQAIQLLAGARDQVDAVAAATALIPKIFGFDGPRSWIMGAENLAELRGRGGYMGSLGRLDATNGKIKFGDFQPVTGLPPLPDAPIEPKTGDLDYLLQYGPLGMTAAWQNLLMSPDFPTGARVLMANLEKVGRPKADGLISLDPIALSYLMEVTGPIDVPGIPETLTSANVVDWALNRLYFLYSDENDNRKELLSTIATTVWDRLLAAENLDGRKAAEAMGKAISGRHLVIYSSRAEEQAMIEQLGIGGLVDRSDNDSLLLVSQNLGENKMDYYVTRKLEYTGVISDDGSLEAEAQITLTNTAPAGALPFYVGGARSRIQLPAGSSRSFVSLFVPARARVSGVTLAGVPTAEFENSLEQGKRRLAGVIELAPGATQKLAFRYVVPRALKDGTYTLQVQNQATVKPDLVTVRIQMPGESEGKQGLVRNNSLAFSGPLVSSVKMAATLREQTSPSLFDRITNLMRRPLSGSGGN